jgi:putative FmdB family regulatory protein
MPQYNYICNACENRWDEIRTLNEWADPIVCPNCQQEGRQVITEPVAFSLKGSGWTPKHYEATGKTSRGPKGR